MITSSGRALWMRFNSDSTIQYTGFKAVYTFIENPLDDIPDIGPCTFETGGLTQEFIGSDNITEDRKQHSLTYDTPIDCLWTITAEEDFKVYIQFGDNYELEHPNDCHLNYIQIFDGKTDMDKNHLKETFCGSVAESFTSDSNIVYVRFYAEKTGIKSNFKCTITAIRPINPPLIVCDPEIEHDCDDATCIHKDLVCNGIRNCKFGWDEESCAELGAALAMDFSSAQIVVILIILTIIMVGMIGGAICSFWRTMREDKEELEASRAVEAAEVAEVANDLDGLSRPKSKASDGNNGGCYVPDAGFPINTRL